MSIRPLLPHLTGLRGVAAYMVLIAHIMGPHRFLYDFQKFLAYFGMTLFFVLSGFVITYNYDSYFRQHRYLKAVRIFFVARIARLYPLYLLFLFTALPQVMVHGYFLSFFTLTQTWFNQFSVAFNHAWSISAEMFFYVAFILVVPFFNLITTRRQAIMLAVGVIFGSYAYVYYCFANLDTIVTWWETRPLLAPTFEIRGWFVYYSPYIQLCSFLAGCVSAKLYQIFSQDAVSSARGRKINSGLLVILLTIVTLDMALPNGESYWDFISLHYLYAPIIAALLCTWSLYGGKEATLLSTPVMIFAGEISYSVYVIQHNVFYMLNSSGAFTPLLELLFVTVFAYGSYRLIEVPGRNWIRRIGMPKRTDQALASQQSANR